MELWDPIGVADSSEAGDEYDSYLYPIAGELRDGSIDSLAEYLHNVATVQMGLERGPADDRRAAEALFDRCAVALDASTTP